MILHVKRDKTGLAGRERAWVIAGWYWYRGNGHIVINIITALLVLVDKDFAEGERKNKSTQVS